MGVCVCPWCSRKSYQYTTTPPSPIYSSIHIYRYTFMFFSLALFLFLFIFLASDERREGRGMSSSSFSIMLCLFVCMWWWLGGGRGWFDDVLFFLLYIEDIQDLSFFFLNFNFSAVYDDALRLSSLLSSSLLLFFQSPQK